MEDHDLLEFDKLKDEQIGRLTYRDTLFYFTMTIIGGGLAIVSSSAKDQAVDILLALPFAIFIAGVAHITCDRRIEDIGIYIRDVLAVAIAEKRNLSPKNVFSWEIHFRMAPLHRARKRLQFAANLLLYSLSGIAILFFYLLLKPNPHLSRVLKGNAPQINSSTLVQSLTGQIGGIDVIKNISSVYEFFALCFGFAMMLTMAGLLTWFSRVKWTQISKQERARHRLRLLIVLVAMGTAAATVTLCSGYIASLFDIQFTRLQIYGVAAVVASIVGAMVRKFTHR